MVISYVVVLLSCVVLSREETVVVTINDSEIVGQLLHTVFDRTPYVAFWKIPYAKPPIADLRFKPPKRPSKWFYNDRTYDYSNPYNNSCASGIEDCLYLSLYTPVPEYQTDNLPVLVWINEYPNLHEPDFFIDEQVIVITVSFRTSIFGFLNTEDEFAQGNMGAKDIIMALEWINQNICFFKGDNDRVTVAGAGKSATIVASLLLTTTAAGLFKRIIIQSGSALSPADYRIYNLDSLNKLYWKLHGPFDKFNRTNLYEHLINASTHDLIDASQLYDSTEVRDNQRLINSFGITIESKKGFMNKHPIEVYRRGMTNNQIDVVIGYTTLESLHKLGGLAKNRKLLKYLNYNFQYLLPFEGATDEYKSKRYRKISRRIMDFYFINGTIGERSLRRYAKYVSDQVIYPLLRQARIHSKTSCNKVYLYRFAFNGALNVAWRHSVGDLEFKGATFGDEICYLFKCKYIEVYNGNDMSIERKFIRQIGRLFANFVKYGDPTPQANDIFTGHLKWEPLSVDHKMKAMNLNEKTKMVNIPEEKRMKFWDLLKEEFFNEHVRDEF